MRAGERKRQEKDKRERERERERERDGTCSKFLQMGSMDEEQAAQTEKVGPSQEEMEREERKRGR